MKPHRMCLLSPQFVCSSVVHCNSCHTCSHKQDASTKQDVVLAAVDTSNPDTQATQHEQNGTEDWEEAGCTHYTCEYQMERDSYKKNREGSSIVIALSCKLVMVMVHAIQRCQEWK